MLFCEHLVWGNPVAWMAVINILVEPVAFNCEMETTVPTEAFA